MSGKGGHKHFAKPYVDPYLLYKAFHTHEELLKSFGAYETVSRSQATDAKGLIHCLPLLEDLLKISPSGEIHPNPLRQSIMKLVQEKPAMNQTDWNCQVWANMRAERVTVILLHLRRLKSEEEMRKCVGKLTGKDCLQLKNLVSMLGNDSCNGEPLDKRDKEEPLDKRGMEEGKEEEGEEGEEEEEEEEEEQKAETPPLDKRRTLQKHESDVSLNSSGFPACLNSPGQSEPLPSKADPLPKGGSFMKRRKGYKLAAQSSSWKPQDKDTGLTKAMGLGTKKESTSKKSSKKKPASSTASSSSNRKPWHKVYVTYPTNPERAYLTGSTGPGKKAQLIIEVTRKQSPKYREVIGIIKRKLENEHITKEEAIKSRAELLGW